MLPSGIRQSAAGHTMQLALLMTLPNSWAGISSVLLLQLPIHSTTSVQVTV